MAREGIEMLLDITDRSYNVLYYIDYTYSTCALQLLQCKQLVYFLSSLKRKIEHVYFSRLERQRTLSLSLSLSLPSPSLSLSEEKPHFCLFFHEIFKTVKKYLGSKYVEPALNHEMVRAVLTERQTSDFRFSGNFM